MTIPKRPKPAPERAETGAGSARPLELGLMATRIGFRLRMLQALLAERIITAYEKYGLRPGTFTTMALMSANPGCSQSDLAREGGLDKSVLVAIVDELERRGLATRDRSTVDRRRNALFLTPAGETLMAQMYETGLATERCIRDGIPQTDLDTLFRVLERAYQIVAKEAQASD